MYGPEFEEKEEIIYKIVEGEGYVKKKKKIIRKIRRVKKKSINEEGVPKENSNEKSKKHKEKEKIEKEKEQIQIQVQEQQEEENHEDEDINNENDENQ